MIQIGRRRKEGERLDFTIPADIQRTLDALDDFIAREIAPLEREHPEFFDHWREHARTDWEHGGQPRPQWQACSPRCAGAPTGLRHWPSGLIADR